MLNSKILTHVVVQSGLLLKVFTNVTLSTSFIFVNCASISAFISDPVFNVLFYIPEGNSPLTTV